MNNSDSRACRIMEDTEMYMVRNYNRLPVVFTDALGVWVRDVNGDVYLDMLATYSACNMGHRNPRILKVIREQVERMTMMAGAFYNDKTAELARKLCEFTDMDKVMFKNSGAEGVEAAIKLSRKWGYIRKKISTAKAEIIFCHGNFHGRTYGPISGSSVSGYRYGFEPFLPGIRWVPFGDPDALGRMINENTAAFIVEPIQGEGGINIPPNGYLKEVERICNKNKVLLVLDEVQTGLGRTGRDFAFQHEEVRPDLLILAKALGGGVIPISAVLGRLDVMSVIGPGDDGSTFGGNPLASAVACEAIDVLRDEQLAHRSKLLGDYLVSRLRKINSSAVKDVRGRGLLVGLELDVNIVKANDFVAQMLINKVICKDTHGNVVRFSPPLTIDAKELDIGIVAIEKVLRRYV